MDRDTCNVIYVDRNVRDDTQLSTASLSSDKDTTLGESTELRANLDMLIEAFGEVHVCSSGAACVSKLLHLHDISMVELKPTLVLIDTPHDEQILESIPPSRDPSPHSRVFNAVELDLCVDQELYGLTLLEKIVFETHSRNLSKLVVPIPIITFPLLQSPPANDGSADEAPQAPYVGYLAQEADPSSRLLTNRGLLRKCLDSGAVDVMASPIHMKSLTTLEVHAYRAHKEALKEQQAIMEIRRGRKRSWVGHHEEKPFGYLREAMVSGLMNGICRTGEENDAVIGNVKIGVSAEGRLETALAVAKWHFDAHSFCDDQLLIAANLMFRHALNMPELEKWRIPTDQLTAFLVACRAAYNTFVPYHNFRHAVDVLQATFNFLVHIGALPSYPAKSETDGDTPAPKSPVAALLKPFEALTLLVAAIGHDVGHPGVNNGFLVVLNAPLAQLYNDRSVLESFHCAAYSQILRRYWPKVFEDTKMRNLMISSILATDMGIHFDYMAKLGSLQERFHKNNDSSDGWNGRTLETETALACAILIKCADISNVAREYKAAVKWMHILCDEFSRQASMETEIGIPSSLIAEPKKDFLSLAKAQLGFLNMFAIPLFQGVADILPAMQYMIDEIESNKVRFEEAIQNLPQMDEEKRKCLEDGALLPRTLSMAITPGDSRDSSSGKTLQLPVQSVPENDTEMMEAGCSSPAQQPRGPNVPGEYKEVNGVSSTFDGVVGVASFAASDPFNITDGENRVVGHNGKQRCSETTEGSNSMPYSGDWASQATSATTGKMPLSPSTQGTSIISQESMERPSSVPIISSAPVEMNHPDDEMRQLAPPTLPIMPIKSEEELCSESTSKGDKSLKKKPSRFRMNALKLFRRDKSNPPSNGESGG